MNAKSSYYVVITASPGSLLLGGVPKTQSSRFANRKDAALWAECAVETNREAGRDVERFDIKKSKRKAEIA